MSVEKTISLIQCGERANLKEHQQVLFLMLQEFDRVCAELNIPYVLFAGTMLGAVKYQGFIPWDDDLDVAMRRPDYERFLREAPSKLGSEFFLQVEYTDHWPMFFSKLRLNGTTCIEGYHPKDIQTHRGVYIDIFPLDNGYNNSIARKLQWICSKVVIAKGLGSNGYETKSKKKKMVIAIARILPVTPFRWITKGPQKQTKYLHSFLGGSSKYGKSVYLTESFKSSIMMPFEGRLFPVAQGYHALLTTMYGNYSRTPSEKERTDKRHALVVDLKKPYTEYNEFVLKMEIDNPGRSIR